MAGPEEGTPKAKRPKEATPAKKKGAATPVVRRHR